MASHTGNPWNAPRKPVLPETFKKAYREAFPSSDIVPAEGDLIKFVCPECGITMGEVKRTTFRGQDGKLVSVWYLGHGDDSHHGFAYRSRHCDRSGMKKRHFNVPQEAPKEMGDEEKVKLDEGEEEEEVREEKPKAKGDGITALILDAIRGDIEGVVEQKLISTIDKIVASGALTKNVTHTIKKIDGSEIKVPEEAHVDLVKVLKAYHAGVRNILLVGPGGTGKTTLAFALIKALGLEHWSYDTFSYMTEPERIYGYRDLLNGGKFVGTPFTDTIPKVSASVFDEFDAMNSNSAVPLNSYLANGKLVTACGPIERHPDNVFIGIANTYGHGATRMYAGRNQLDAATLDRFFVITIGYDTGLEKRLFPSLDHDFVAKVRKSIETNGIRRLFGTRTLQRVSALIAMGDASDTQSAVKVLTSSSHENWSDEDRSMAGIA